MSTQARDTIQIQIYEDLNRTQKRLLGSSK
jgi:hypothetical protein